MERDKGTRGQGDKGGPVGVARAPSALLVFCLCMAGCQQNDADSDSVTAATSGNEADSGASDDVEATDITQHDAANSSGSEGTDSGDDTATEVTPTDSPETERARDLFASLLEPQSPEEWDQAQAELKDLGPAVIPVLIESLESSNRIEREMAAQHLVLLELDLSGETDDLLAALGDESEQVRGYCAAVLLTQSPDAAEQAVATLVDVLGGNDPAMSEMSASYLQTFPESVVTQLPQVIAALENAPPEVAIPLINALAAAGPQAADAGDVLNELSVGDDPEVAAVARQALDAISGPSE